jgi:hypothetical protein
MIQDIIKLFSDLKQLILDIGVILMKIIKSILKILIPLLISASSCFLMFKFAGLFKNHINYFINLILNMNFELFLVFLSSSILLHYFCFFKIVDYIRKYINTKIYMDIGSIFEDYILIILILLLTYLFVFKNLFHFLSKSSIWCIITIVIHFFSGVVAIIIAFIPKKQIKILNIKIEGPLEPDTPIQNEEQDKLNRNEFINNLAKEIEGIKFKDSFVYGMYGGWGDGKTSALNLLINKLTISSKFIIYKFDAWNYSDVNSMINAFYNGIVKTLEQEFINRQLIRNINKYLKLILTNLNKSLGDILNYKEMEDTEKIRDIIENMLLKIKKKLIIVIDDLDRLERNEILTLFKQIGLNFKLKNTIFILSLDVDIVKTILSNNCTNPQEKSLFDDFVDKIIQRQITLPPIETIQISNFLEHELESNISSLLKEDNEKKNFLNELKAKKDLLNELSSLKITNLRKARIFLNSIKATIGLFENRVNYMDFILLQILQIFYLKIWRFIYNKKNMFFSIKNELIHRYIKNNCGDIPQETDNFDIVRKIIIILFPYLENTQIKNDQNQMKIYKEQKRICHPENIGEYFKFIKYQESIKH